MSWISALSTPRQVGVIVIPGLGRADRLQTVLYNLKVLQTNLYKDWTCIVYVYERHNNTAFWRHSDMFHLQSLCSVIENPGGRVTENLHLLTPAIVANRGCSYVFVLLDDCRLSPSFSLSRLLHLMNHNNLTVASPRVIGANRGGGQKFRNVMQQLPSPGSAGYITRYLELFAWVMTAPAYAALWRLLWPTVNPYGWGHDFWYDEYGRATVPGHRMGVLSVLEVVHDQAVAGDGDHGESGRTDTTAVATKWAAVMAQEKHYSSALQIDLKRYRKNMRLFNNTWSGAVVGLLYHPDAKLGE